MTHRTFVGMPVCILSESSILHSQPTLPRPLPLCMRRMDQLTAAVVAFRLLNAALVTTQFDPDEWWQAPEVAHRLVFGYGVLTWEWQHALRGYTHILPFAAAMQLLKWLRLDSATAIAHVPRLMQGGCAAVGDLCLHRVARRYFGCDSVADCTLLASWTSWFVGYCGVRTYSSTAEATMLLATLCLLPLPGVPEPASPPDSLLARPRLRRSAGGALAALAMLVRPTAALVLVPMLLAWLVLPSMATTPAAAPDCTAPVPMVDADGGSRAAGRPSLAHRAWSLAPCVAAGTATLLAGLCVDRWCHGRWVVTWLNFLRFNALARGADYYGTHPPAWCAGLAHERARDCTPMATHTRAPGPPPNPRVECRRYLSHAAPAVLGTHAPLVLLGVWHSVGRRAVAFALLLATAALSLAPHKELRFLYPLVPFALAYAGVALHRMRPQTRRACTLALVATNLPAAVYLGRWHGAAPLAAMATLRAHVAHHGDGGKHRGDGALSRDDAPLVWLDLLTRCHQTPAYAQLHACVRISLLPCPPPAIIQTGAVSDASAEPRARRRARPEATSRCANECDCFFEAPAMAVARRYGAADGWWQRALRLGRTRPLPSHVLLFDELYDEPKARAVLDALGFAAHASYFHELEWDSGSLRKRHGWALPLRVRRLVLLTRRQQHRRRPPGTSGDLRECAELTKALTRDQM